MATLKELSNKTDAIQAEFECEVEKINQEIAERKLQLSRLHKGMHIKISRLQKSVAKAAEANAKTV